VAGDRGEEVGFGGEEVLGGVDGFGEFPTSCPGRGGTQHDPGIGQEPVRQLHDPGSGGPVRADRGEVADHGSPVEQGVTFGQPDRSHQPVEHAGDLVWGQRGNLAGAAGDEFGDTARGPPRPSQPFQRNSRIDRAVFGFARPALRHRLCRFARGDPGVEHPGVLGEQFTVTRREHLQQLAGKRRDLRHPVAYQAPLDAKTFRELMAELRGRQVARGRVVP